MPAPRLLAVLSCLALAGGAIGCGGSDEEHDAVTHAETEGVYVDVEHLRYQVQISRELNPAIPRDRTFLSGISAEDREIALDETWFAVFVRIENGEKEPQEAARTFVIEDTEGNSYRPVTLGSENPFQYPTGPIPAESVVPDPNSVAGALDINGTLLLFKIKRTSLDDRPLVLKIHSPENFSEVSEVDIDV